MLGREGPLPARPPPGEASSPSPECVVCKGPALENSMPALPPVRAAPGPPRRGASGGVEPGGPGAVAPGWSWTRPTPGAPGPSTAGTPVVAAWWVDEDRAERGGVRGGGRRIREVLAGGGGV
jgi:hypothetical protein